MQKFNKYTIFLVTLWTVLVVNGVKKTTVSNEEIQAYLSSGISKSNITLEDVKNLLYKKCKQAFRSANLTAETLYENIEKAANNFMDCASGISNITLLLADYEEACPNGNLDIFFEKYCGKMPRVKQCLKDFNDQLLSCLTPSERDQNAIIMRVVARLLDFACESSGAHLAMFIAEDGPVCIVSNKENIINCMNATLSASLPTMLPSDLPELVLGPKQCIDLYDFEECVLSYVENCNEVTPSNLIESVFRYVLRETKCQAEIDKVIERNSQQRNLATGTTFSWIPYVMSVVVAFKLNY